MTYIPIRYYVTEGRWSAYVIVDKLVGNVIAEFDRRVDAQREVRQLRLEHEASVRASNTGSEPGGNV